MNKTIYITTAFAAMFLAIMDAENKLYQYIQKADAIVDTMRDAQT